MLEMQAVVGRIQLKRMSDWTDARTRNAQAIWNTCRGYAAIRVPALPDGIEHAHYKCYVYVDQDRLAPGWTRDRIVEEITRLGVPCYQGSCSEVYLERAFEGTSLRPTVRLPNARELGDSSLMFLVHPTLTGVEIDTTCTVINHVLAEASPGHASGSRRP
jgi:dTDP-4-amino-4,6-dideoxygalactose transaminase